MPDLPTTSNKLPRNGCHKHLTFVDSCLDCIKRQPDTSNISNVPPVYTALQALADFKAGGINAQQVTNIIATYIQQEKSALLNELVAKGKTYATPIGVIEAVPVQIIKDIREGLQP